MELKRNRNESRTSVGLLVRLLQVVVIVALTWKRRAGGRKIRIEATPSVKDVGHILPLPHNLSGATYLFTPKSSISNWHLNQDSSDT